MTIKKTRTGERLDIALTGRLDAAAAARLDGELKESCEGVTELVMDFSRLSGLSSEGLQVLLDAQKVMNRQGRMVLRHVNGRAMETLVITGLADILTVE